MPNDNVIKETYTEFGGLDYRSNSVTRKARFAKETNNALYLKNNSFSCRPGQKGKAPSKGGGGTKEFTYRTTSGGVQTKLLTIDSNLHQLDVGAVSITYSGASTNVEFAIKPTLTGTTYSFYATLSEDDVVVYSKDLGTGINEVTPVSITTLVAEIDALANYACSITAGTGSGPAAFIGNQIVALSASPTSVAFDYWVQVYCPTTNPFSTFFTAITGADAEIADMFNHANRFFIATGHNELYKYDSNSVYRAGMPSATTLSAAAVAGPGLTGDYEWFITYEQEDVLGKITEGDESNSATLTLAAQKGRVTIPTIQTSTGFLTSYAQVNGAQVGVTTITVDGGHTLQIGQNAFFLDNTGAEITRQITARTNTTISISGGAVTVADNEAISANLKINLWRNKAGSLEVFYLVKTFANNSSVASFTYDDAIADASLAVEYEFPAEGHGLPPANLKYFTSYNGLLIGANAGEDVSYSDFDGPEYFNSSFSIKSKSNNPVKGIGANKDALIIFKEDEGHVLVGDLVNSRYRIQTLSDEIGCSSHHSIIDVSGTLWFYSKKHGPRRVVSTGLPDDVSYRILPAITNPPTSDEETIVHERVIALDFKDDQMVLFFCPTETNLGGTIYPNSTSFVLAADYRSQMEEDVEYDEQGRATARVPKVRWWRWTNINLGGGGTTYNGEVVFTEKRYSDTKAAMEYSLCSFLDTLQEYDYSDHAQPIDFEYDAGWETLGKPDLKKKFNQVAILSFPDGFSTSFSLNVEAQIDFIDGAVHSQKLLSFGQDTSGAGYGYPAWGNFAWGDAVTSRKIFPLKLNKSHAIKLRFSKQVWLEKPVISGWSYEANPAFAPKVQQ